MDIELIESPSTEVISAIYDGLHGFNIPHFPGLDIKTFAWVIRSEAGDVIGGLTAKVLLTSLHIDLLWLPESIRAKGLGRELVKTAEREAAKYGAERVFVDTYSFQGPGFYQKLRFVEVGRYRDYPRVGVDKIFYSKVLEPDF